MVGSDVFVEPKFDARDVEVSHVSPNDAAG